MCKWPWCGLWLSHHTATYLCSNFTSSTDLLEVNTPTTSNVTKWDAIHSDWQYLLEFNNKFGNWRGCPIYGPLPHRPFHRRFWVCGYQAQGCLMYWTTKFCSKWLPLQVSDSTKYYARPHSAYVFVSNKKSEKEMARNWMRGFYIHQWWLDFGFYNEPFWENNSYQHWISISHVISVSVEETQLTFSVEMEIIQLWPRKGCWCHQQPVSDMTTSILVLMRNVMILLCVVVRFATRSNFKVISGEETEARSIDQCEEDLYIRCIKCTSAKMDSVEY